MADLKVKDESVRFLLTSRLFKASQELVFLCLNSNVRSLSKSKRKLKKRVRTWRPSPLGLKV